MKIKGNKAQVQITLPPELVEKARKYGLNISKIAENALDDAVRRMESPERPKGVTDCPSKLSNSRVVARDIRISRVQ